ncbi:Por secretion system C-terminal sorting domain-containing protein [Hymenobacter daecheongensis DSM 21074]|uniref:Por secretion system C-terminal sorting domain-containing protein n=1 Tax=Hymenobacter daecheongensis DSM 21074 TaxID=1121955 RepID=A0A1M6KHS3_9BACT|nr:SBBP repeat-containing protein [Hymenobacter daecheongensis]SHJ58508.1 Por secretion system C-terminal sorting domain-containing protein [Hymenobacter daecheongensis DSM 21074]
MKKHLLATFLASAVLLTAQAQAFQWNQQAGGAAADEGRGVAVDGQGNAYVAGLFRGAATFGTGAAQVTLNSTPPLVGTTPTADAVLAKYAPSGALLWARRGGGPGTEETGGVALDPLSGGAYVIGSFSGSATFDSGLPGTMPVLTSAGADDLFLVKYDAAGTLLWSRALGSANASAESGYAIATDSVGNAYLTGEFRDTPVLGGGTATVSSAGNTDVLIAKYSPAGTLLWARRGGAADADVGRAIAVDRAGACVVTGSFRGTATFEGGAGSPAVTLRARSGSADVFVVKYDAGGTPLWGRVGYGSGVKIGRGICTDRRKDIYLMTYFNDGLILTSTPTDSVQLTTTPGNRDVVVVKYSPQGTIQWTRPAGGPALDTGINIAADGQNNIYALSYFQQTMTFPPGTSAPGVPGQTVTSAGSADAVVASYTAGGVLRWLRRLGGPLDDLGYGLAPDNAGNLLLTGYFTGGPFTADGTLPLFTQPSNVRDIFISRLQNILTSTRAAGRLAAGLQAWPNPTADRLHLRLASAHPATATLLDARGRELQTLALTAHGPGQQAELSLAGRAAGLYLVRVQSEGASVTLRVVRP